MLGLAETQFPSAAVQHIAIETTVASLLTAGGTALGKAFEFLSFSFSLASYYCFYKAPGPVDPFVKRIMP